MISADEFAPIVVKVTAKKRNAGPSADQIEAKKSARLKAFQVRIAKAQRRVAWAERAEAESSIRLANARALLAAIQKARDEAAR